MMKLPTATSKCNVNNINNNCVCVHSSLPHIGWVSSSIRLPNRVSSVLYMYVDDIFLWFTEAKHTHAHILNNKSFEFDYFFACAYFINTVTFVGCARGCIFSLKHTFSRYIHKRQTDMSHAHNSVNIWIQEEFWIASYSVLVSWLLTES